MVGSVGLKEFCIEVRIEPLVVEFVTGIVSGGLLHMEPDECHVGSVEVEYDVGDIFAGGPCDGNKVYPMTSST